MEEPWRVRLLVGLWLFWQRLRSGDLEGHILGFYCAEAPPAELKSLNVYKVYFCSRSSSLFPNKYQANINMCTTAPLPLPSWSRPLIIVEKFSFCANFGHLPFLCLPDLAHLQLRKTGNFLFVWILVASSDTSPHCWHLSNCAGQAKTNLETETNETWHINTCINFILSHLTKLDDNDYMT